MAAANGTPIRLVQENGNLIELDATTINFTVERGFQPHAVPASGGRRFGIDLNKNRSLIVVEGVFTDDRGPGVDTAATAVMDFSLSQEDFVKSFTSGGMDLTGLQGTFVTNDNIDNFLLGNNSIRVKNSAGEAYYLLFESTSTIGYNTSTDKLCIKDSDDGTRITAAQFATGVAAWINTDVTDMTASVIASDKTGKSGEAVLITQSTRGEDGNQFAFPEFAVIPAFNATKTIKSPYIEKFSGGRSSNAKSAGDKVMDMYGILNNSGRQSGERVTDLLPSEHGVFSDTMKSITRLLEGLALNIVTFGGAALNSMAADGDYIIGIQIPYNSKIQSGSDTYVARNFFQPSGILKSAKDKGSEANTLPASAKFDDNDEYTGIQGTIKKMDIFYDAGETVYGYRMDFAPMDYMQ